MKRLLFIFLLFISTGLFAQEHYYLLAGTYTRGKSKGIYVYDFNSKDGSTVLIDSAITANPSYLAVSPDERFVYAVNEEGSPTRAGKVKAYAFDKKKGSLSPLNEQSSKGDNPCYIAVDQTGKWVTVGNYTSGSLAVLPVQKDGSVGAAVTTIQHYGHSVNLARQEAPHVHSTIISPDNQYLFVPDLGKDKIMIYNLDTKTGSLSQTKDSAVQLPAGSGPRHFIFHPNKKWAYLVQELSGNVTAYNYKHGKLEPFQTISALPAGYHEFFTSADIHVSPDGRFLYASNRDSSNTIAVFSVHPQSGKLTLVGHQSTMGRTPRNFNFDPSGNYLLVANQNSDNIVVFKINRQTGLLTDTGKRIVVGNPVCVKWIKK